MRLRLSSFFFILLQPSWLLFILLLSRPILSRECQQPFYPCTQYPECSQYCLGSIVYLAPCLKAQGNGYYDRNCTCGYTSDEKTSRDIDSFFRKLYNCVTKYCPGQDDQAEFSKVYENECLKDGFILPASQRPATFGAYPTLSSSQQSLIASSSFSTIISQSQDFSKPFITSTITTPTLSRSTSSYATPSSSATSVPSHSQSSWNGSTISGLIVGVVAAVAAVVSAILAICSAVRKGKISHPKEWLKRGWSWICNLCGRRKQVQLST